MYLFSDLFSEHKQALEIKITMDGVVRILEQASKLSEPLVGSKSEMLVNFLHALGDPRRDLRFWAQLFSGRDYRFTFHRV